MSLQHCCYSRVGACSSDAASSLRPATPGCSGRRPPPVPHPTRAPRARHVQPNPLQSAAFACVHRQPLHGSTAAARAAAPGTSAGGATAEEAKYPVLFAVLLKLSAAGNDKALDMFARRTPAATSVPFICWLVDMEVRRLRLQYLSYLRTSFLCVCAACLSSFGTMSTACVASMTNPAVRVLASGP